MSENKMKYKKLHAREIEDGPGIYSYTESYINEVHVK